MRRDVEAIRRGDPRFAEAKLYFFQNDGSRYMMWRDGGIEWYVDQAVPSDVEHRWYREMLQEWQAAVTAATATGRSEVLRLIQQGGGPSHGTSLASVVPRDLTIEVLVGMVALARSAVELAPPRRKPPAGSSWAWEVLHATMSIDSTAQWAARQDIDGAEKPVGELTMLLRQMATKARGWAGPDDHGRARFTELCGELVAK